MSDQTNSTSLGRIERRNVTPRRMSAAIIGIQISGNMINMIDTIQILTAKAE